jgi:ubiquinone/menaquinone biosynthesis C-methylase UbiE
VEDPWQVAYRDEIEIYETLSRHEDAGNKVVQRLEDLYSFRGRDVLEIGCGPGRYTLFLARASRRYWALDVSAPLLMSAKAKCRGFEPVRWLLGSAGSIPLREASVDAVFASWVLTAMTTDEMRETTDREIRRVLRPGGDIWLFENAGGDEFVDDLWGLEMNATGDPVPYVLQPFGYQPVEVVETRFAFPDVETARRVFGFLLGEHALAYLARKPKTHIQHRVMILHKTKGPK